MRAATPCKRCGGEVILLADRAWCAKPSLDGGCGGRFREIDGRWRRVGRGKVARIEPIVKAKKPVPCPVPTAESATA